MKKFMVTASCSDFDLRFFSRRVDRSGKKTDEENIGRG